MLSIDLSTTRDQIKKDPDLLFFLLQSVSEKTTFIANSRFETTDIRSKVLYYLEYEAKDNMILNNVQIISMPPEDSYREFSKNLLMKAL